MIARVWLPLQVRIGPRLLALALGAIGAVRVGWEASALVSALAAGAVGLTYAERTNGHYAYGSGTGYLWLAGQFALVGAMPDVRVFGAVAVGLALATAGLVPWAAARERGVTVGRSVPLAAWRPSPGLLVGVLGATAVAAIIVRFADGGGAAAVGDGWPWAIGWMVVWAAWRQSLHESLGFVVGLAAGLFTFSAIGVAVAPLAAGLSLAAPVALRIAADRGSSPVAILVAVSTALLVSGFVGGPSGLLGGAVAVALWLELRFIPNTTSARGSDRSRPDRVRAALDRLPPYPRWYGISKLASDSLFERVIEADGLSGAVLDVGCGMALAGALKEVSSPDRYLGLDIDPDKLRSGARLLAALGADSPRLELKLASLECGNEERFDRVLLLDVLHYWPGVEQAEILRLAAQMLRPGGHLFVRDPVLGVGDKSVPRSERSTTFFGFNPRGRIQFMMREDWDEMFVQAGLGVESEFAFPDGNVLFVLAATRDQASA